MMSVIVPVKVMVASDVPSPTAKLSPVVPLKLIVPFTAVSVSLTAARRRPGAADRNLISAREYERAHLHSCSARRALCHRCQVDWT